ncbi:MAG: hypothetical protein E3J25_06445 [Anaerolineales bacterium]|nr:MAG: hypothetical protein E3J25_06445 [Anaerolineales bacterium]
MLDRRTTRPPDQVTDLIPIHTLFPDAKFIDDNPLWLAWETAKEAWLAAKHRKSGSQSTPVIYRDALQRFFAWARRPPWEISSMHAQQYASWLASDRETDNLADHMALVAGTCASHGQGPGPLAPATINQQLAALSGFYDFVRRRYTVTKPDGTIITLVPADKANPFDVIERVKISPYGRATFPTVEELKAILAVIDTRSLTGKRAFAMLYTIATTCKRSSEILNLRWGDLEKRDDGDTNFTYKPKGKEPTRGVLNHKAYQALCAYLRADGRPPEEMQDDDYIFIPMHPGRIRRFKRMQDHVIDPDRPITNREANRTLKVYARRAGVDESKAHIHGLRHAGARLRVQQMKESGRPIDYEEIMNLLGHSNLAITQIYIKTVLEDPEDPGGQDAADELMPSQRRRRPKKPPPPEQGTFL